MFGIMSNFIFLISVLSSLQNNSNWDLYTAFKKETHSKILHRIRNKCPNQEEETKNLAIIEV